MIEKIVENGINKKEIIDGDKNVIASGIFGFTCSSLIYKMRTDKEINVQELYSEIEKHLYEIKEIISIRIGKGVQWFKDC